MFISECVHECVVLSLVAVVAAVAVVMQVTLRLLRWHPHGTLDSTRHAHLLAVVIGLHFDRSATATAVAKAYVRSVLSYASLFCRHKLLVLSIVIEVIKHELHDDDNRYPAAGSFSNSNQRAKEPTERWNGRSRDSHDTRMRRPR